jgi:adenosylcobinamide-phosphate synthase
MYFFTTLMEIGTGLLILVAALLLDVALGEAPNRYHPVAWLGRLISFQLKLKPQGKGGQLAYGAAMVLSTCLVAGLPIYLLTSYLQSLNTAAYVVVSAYLLKNTFSLRGLWQAIEKMKISLRSERITTARSDVTALVHRNPDNLSEEQLISATIESCAENLCDSFIAPLLYFAIFGLPAAIVYRIVNTFDAMIGYHGEWEYTGKFAARFDDMLNYIPARISALLIIIGAAICRTNYRTGWQTMLRQHSRTESPNAGWTMSAMAGSLGIMLEKAGHYSLGDEGAQPSLAAIGKSQAILLVAASTWGLIIIGKEVLVAATT